MSFAALRRLLRDTAGTTAIEYALIAALIGMVALGAIMSLGDSLDNHYTDIQTAVTDARR